MTANCYFGIIIKGAKNFALYYTILKETYMEELGMIGLPAAIIIFIIVYNAFNRAKSKKRLEEYLRSSYGKPRSDFEEQNDRLGDIETLYLTQKPHKQEHETVDDITWEDLGMDDIFMLINHTDSFAGEQHLYSRLHDLSRDDSDEFEEKIEFFDKNEDVRHKVRTTLFRLGKRVINYDLPLQIQNITSYRLPCHKVYYGLCAMTVILGIAAAVTRLPAFIAAFVGIYVVGLTVHSIVKARHDMNIRSLFALGRMLGAALTISGITDKFGEGIRDDLRSMEKAAKRSAYMESKNAVDNADQFSMFTAYLLGPFMIDFIIYDRIISDINRRNEECRRVYDFLGSIDCAIAVGSFRRSMKVWCVPETAKGDAPKIKGLVHPAIPNAVPNDLEYERPMMITGSNASGKSTYIKTAAINLILAQTIHTCTAESAEVPRCCVMTSMAVRDDIISGESYYIREIRYLKRMIELCREDRLLFLAIDEILKGTNTRERIAASKAILEHLEKKRCILMIATHDLELAKDFDGRFDNRHFSEVIGTDDVIFDYTMHDGISTTSNAIKLLKATGFPEDIVAMAERAVGG